MASVGGGSSKGKRTSDVDLNIVPFIDLMSVLITFLLITAVWNQVSMLQAGSSIYGKKTNDDNTPPPPLADIPLRLDVKPAGFRLIIGRETFQYPRSGQTYVTEGLAAKLAEIKKTYPEKVDAVITTDDDVNYEYMILGMDTLNKSGFPSVSVSTVAAE